MKPAPPTVTKIAKLSASRLLLVLEMILQDLGDTAGQPLARLDVQELIGSVRI